MVHQYKLDGYNIVLDTCSGGIHVVDEVAYDMIELYPTMSKEDIIAKTKEKYADRDDVTEEELELCMQDIQSLVDAKKLYTEDTCEPMAGTSKFRS